MYQFNPITASQNIKESFVDYITTSFNMADRDYAEKFRAELVKEGYIAKGPYLDVTGSYKSDRSIHELMQTGDASPLFEELEPVPEKDKEVKLDRPLYCHQQQALIKANAGNNLVVTTGTGSGKTECFLIPIVNALLREKEQGTLDDGVRAIIIYPMNALANDQIKRMRDLLKNYPDITFGLYNGNTEHEEAAGLSSYRKANGKDAKPLKNEMISRARMQETAPHILITNYSMLEYMMLRPKDDAVFSGAKLRYIVLDEAHVYKGTTGMETAMLMRRLRARISTRDTVQYILTSATLGGPDADAAIISFANRLCGVSFSAENIIRSQDATPPMYEEKDFPSELFSDLTKEGKKAADVFRSWQIQDYAPDGDDSEKFYEFLLHCRMFCKFVEATREPKTVAELTACMNRVQPITTEQLIDFIAICTRAEKGKTSLIKAKYHFFVRSLEGAYITLNEPKRVLLHRQDKLGSGEKQQAVFEIAICTDCGRLALVGIEEDGKLKQVSRKTDSDPETCEFYMLDDGSLSGDIYEEDDDEDDYSADENDYVICPRCGQLAGKGDLRFGKICDCDCAISDYIPLKKVKRTKSRTARCAACGCGSLRAFYLGNDAATAVLGTELYEQLPDEEVVKNAKLEVEEYKPKRLNLFSAQKKVKLLKEKKMRQFLCFSDSRSEAANFANNMEKQYQQFLRRRGFFHVAQRYHQRGETNISVSAFVKELSDFFEVNRTFAMWDPDRKTDSDLLRQDSRTNAWIAVLFEMFNGRRGTSLPALGLVSFEYNFMENSLEAISEYLSLPLKDTKALMNLIIMDAVHQGAISADKSISLNAAEHAYIFYTETQKKLLLRMPSKSDKSDEKLMKKLRGAEGWTGHTRPNGNYYYNTRMERITQASGCSQQEADALLTEFWEDIFEPEGEEYILSAEDFRIRIPGDAELKFYRCKKCGRITAYNVKNHCATVKCDGKLEEIDPAILNKDNHYVKLYHSLEMRSLQIKEHTAQLSKNKQTRYQQAFVDKDINALSCSTTFEMGVDVGGLETVYMRNVPPTPANYVQRAGRAGRAMHTAAFVLTYAKLSSHDLTFYQNPNKIICGSIQAPVFEIKNERVISRHIYAVALSRFFAINEDVYARDDRYTFLNDGGYERLVDYLDSKPEDLLKLLKRSVPIELHRMMGIDDYSWTKKLIGEDGVLKIAVDEYREELSSLEKEKKTMQKENSTDERLLSNIRWSILQLRSGPDDGQRKKSLIEFFVRNNVLPKYGFPVDTVELKVNYNDKSRESESLQLARDLQLAIAEYAPGSEVIADGQLYVSRYIRRLPGRKNADAWNFGYYSKCPNPECKQDNYTDHALTRKNGHICSSCKKLIPGKLWYETIEPRRGFLTDGKSVPAPIRRPVRDYRTDDYYVGDTQRKCIDNLLFQVNDRQLKLESTANDTLAVVGYTSYYVCPVCGYADEKGIPARHKTPKGTDCPNQNGTGKEYRLSHTFKTFVAKISFYTDEARDYDTMLSVMYALLEGLSQELGIERTDIKGCLHKIPWNEKGYPINSIVLYDAVAGGAGHVRRLITKDAGVFQKVLKKALSIVRNCNCNPSCYQCLRNYYNSKVHDQLNRFAAAKFLEKWVGEYIPVTQEEEKESQHSDPNAFSMDSDDQGVMEYGSWAQYAEAYDISAVKNWDKVQIPKDCITFPEIALEGEVVSPDFVWVKQKIIVLDPDEMERTQKLQKLGWNCYCIDTDPVQIAQNFKE